jgi:hypothetical protein
MSAATDAKYRQGWADGKAGRDPDSRELAYGSDRLNSYERGYIDSGHLEVPHVSGEEGSGDD